MVEIENLPGRYIKRFECPCYNCTASISLSVSDENLQNLIDDITTCPLCGDDMSKRIAALVRAAVSYNQALGSLEESLENTHGHIE